MKKIAPFAALALLFAGLFAQAQKRQVMLDKVVAVVGGSAILHSEVEEYARQLTERRRQEGYTSDRDPMNEALEALMTQKLLYNQGQIDSVAVNELEIASRVEDQVHAMIEEEGSIPQLEAKFHMAIFNIRETMRQRYVEQAYAQAMRSEVTGKVAVIPGEVERYYESMDERDLPIIPVQYVYAQITKFPKSIKEAKQRTRERLLDMRERAITGKAKFENLARMYSQDPGTMMRGGEMDPTPLAGLDESFAKALEGMKPGQISEVVESQFGFHIIQLLDKRGQLYHFRHILLKPVFTTDELAETVAELDSIADLIRRGFDHVRAGRAAPLGRSQLEDERRNRLEPRSAGALLCVRRQAHRHEVPRGGFRPLPRSGRLQPAGAPRGGRHVGAVPHARHAGQRAGEGGQVGGGDPHAHGVAQRGLPPAGGDGPRGQARAGLPRMARQEDRRHVRLHRTRVPRRGVREQTLGEVVPCAA